MKTRHYCSILLAGVLLAGCSVPAEETKTVSFFISGYSSGVMPSTKGISAEDAATVLAGVPPTKRAALTISSKTKSARVYTADIGDSVTLVYDSYTVSGQSSDADRGTTIYLGRIYPVPTYKVSGEFTVTEADNTYPLTATWDCAALIIRTSEVASFSVSASSTLTADVLSSFATVGDYSVLYVSGAGWSASKPLKVTVTPTDDLNYEPVTYTFTASTLRHGHWYYLSPVAVEVTSGAFTLGFPGWEAGEE